jgi:hypothetical protein
LFLLLLLLLLLLAMHAQPCENCVKHEQRNAIAHTICQCTTTPELNEHVETEQLLYSVSFEVLPSANISAV